MTDLARIIDHTLLKPEATAADVRALVAEARELDTFSVCVSPTMVAVAREAVADLDVEEAEGSGRLRIAAVAGFPSGAHVPEAKALEAARAVADGADEIDMVIDFGRRDLGLDRFEASVEAEVAAVRAAVPDALLKVILETAVLGDDEIVAACRASERAGADFVKTSTGFHPAGGASIHAVELMRATVGDRLGVKASGGIRTREAADAMVAAGATRLGVSSSRAILAGEASTSAY